MTRRAIAIRVGVCALALAGLIAAGPASVEALSVGDYWTYAFHETDPGVEWLGNVTETFSGGEAGPNQVTFRVSGAGTLAGEANGTWTLSEANNYRLPDGAFVSSQTTLRTTYTSLGRFHDVQTVTEAVHNPPIELGGPLEAGAVRTATTTVTTTTTVTEGSVVGPPSTRSASVTFRLEVVGQVSVNVPAGQFQAWQIRFTRSDTSGYAVDDYNDTIGNSVRRRFFDSAGNEVASFLLKEYQYSPRPPLVPSAGLLLPSAVAFIVATGAVVGGIVWWDRRRSPGGVALPGSPPGGPPAPPPWQP